MKAWLLGTVVFFFWLCCKVEIPNERRDPVSLLHAAVAMTVLSAFWPVTVCVSTGLYLMTRNDEYSAKMRRFLMLFTHPNWSPSNEPEQRR